MKKSLLVFLILFTIPISAISAPQPAKEAAFYEKLKNSIVHCLLCPRGCVITDGKRGYCRVRENQKGVLYALSYGQPVAVHVDPIEKKPFFHYLPGSLAYSIATVGCNLNCKFCQNWEISQARPEDVQAQSLTADEIVAAAKREGCRSIAFTYTEPTVFFEYMLEIAQKARAAGLRCVMHSNGFVNEEPLRQLCKYLDAANIDLKGFSESYYAKICDGALAPVLRSLQVLKEEGVHVEITNLVLSGFNDDPAAIRKMCRWIKDTLGADTPLHYSRFYPMYKLLAVIPTPVEMLERARQIAKEEGLNYVYIGNIPGVEAENTYCPNCHRAVIKRVGYSVSEIDLVNGKCKYCQTEIKGVWELPQTASAADALNIKQPNVAGAFYPADAAELSVRIDDYLSRAQPQKVDGVIFGLIMPHAGYEFSGPTAAYGYKLLMNRAYKTVVVIGPNHSVNFNGASVYPEGYFRTPLGDIEIDRQFARQILDIDPNIKVEPSVFDREHSIEVQLPFLQKTLRDFKIVPIMMGNGDYAFCSRLAALLKNAIGGRTDVLVIASSDMYHGYDFDECDAIDSLTLSYVQKMDDAGLYKGLRAGTLQMCGGLPVVTTLILAKSLKHEKTIVLSHTNSAVVTGKMVKGIWTVGYSSIVIDQEKGAQSMILTKEQQKKMLELARKSIETYLKTGRKLQVTETDPVLLKEMGAFVTLHERGELRGCIGNMVGRQPLYLTIRDMAVEAATGDPRFSPVKTSELKDIELEISVLSPMERVDSADKITMGVHGVLVRRGFNTGVFLPQVATETGWNKEQFLSYLCSQKAGLPADAWKDKNTELYTFTAEVFK